MTSIILSKEFAAAQAARENTPNNFDINNKPIGKLGSLMQQYKTAFTNIKTLPAKNGKKSSVIFNLYPEGKRGDKLTVFINGKLRDAHLAQPFQVGDLLSNTLFETTYTRSDGSKDVIVTLQKPSAGIVEDTMFDFASIADALKVAATM